MPIEIICLMWQFFNKITPKAGNTYMYICLKQSNITYNREAQRYYYYYNLQQINNKIPYKNPLYQKCISNYKDYFILSINTHPNGIISINYFVNDFYYFLIAKK